MNNEGVIDTDRSQRMREIGDAMRAVKRGALHIDRDAQCGNEEAAGAVTFLSFNSLIHRLIALKELTSLTAQRWMKRDQMTHRVGEHR
jgi:hypothetical protein